jgi:hypothetical protein
MAASRKQPILASRKLVLKARTGRKTETMRVRIRHPYRSKGDYVCRIEIVRGGTTDALDVRGVDAMQALLLATAYISKQLKPLRNRISWLGVEGESGFPYVVLFIDPENHELRGEIQRALMRDEYRITIKNAKRLGLDA